jgi:hypothetical protein
MSLSCISIRIRHLLDTELIKNKLNTITSLNDIISPNRSCYLIMLIEDTKATRLK